jgi:hypothetical protein
MKKLKLKLKKIWKFIEFIEDERIKCMMFMGHGKV